MPVKGYCSHPIARVRLQQLQKVGDVVIVYQEGDKRCLALSRWVSRFLHETWPRRRFEKTWMEDDGLRVTRTL